jgi:thiamine pyrophosphate-dependent acetolactate synthase large subunit-like protein
VLGARAGTRIVERARAGDPDEIPEVLAEASRRAAAPPQGSTYVEAPFDVLHAPATAPPPGLVVLREELTMPLPTA